MTEPAEPPALRRLRRVAVGVVAAALLAAGGTKLARPDAGVTMLSRYLPSPQAQRAVACLELAVALWLLSGRSPRLAPAVAGGAMIGLGVLVGGEFRRDRPLPCGCFPVRVVPADTAAIRRDLAAALARDALLAALCGIALATTPPQASD